MVIVADEDKHSNLRLSVGLQVHGSKVSSPQTLWGLLLVRHAVAAWWPNGCALHRFFPEFSLTHILWSQAVVFLDRDYFSAGGIRGG